MKKVVIVLIIVVGISILLAILSPSFRDQKRPRSVFTRTMQETVYAKPLAELENLPEGAIVFDVSYVGLTGDQYSSFWGFGQSHGDSDSSFIKEVREKAGKIEVIENPYFPEAMYSAVEILDDKAQVFYFDLDQNGKLSDNEKILPLTPKPEDDSTWVDFITPDFDLKTPDERTVPFRTLAKVGHLRSYKGVNIIDVMWSPACILQGIASIDGEPTRMTLFTNGFNGRFDQFGQGRFSLMLEKDHESEKAAPYGPYGQTLSSLINYNGRFYRLQTFGSNEKGKVFKVALVEDTSPRGAVALNIKADDTLKTKLEYATINGKGDKTVHFNVSGGQSELPEGDYVLSRGRFQYGVEKADEWMVDFSGGPEFVIKPDEEMVVTMGKPAMSIRAVDGNKRYDSDVKEQKSFTKGIPIYLEPKIKGLANEVYGRFTHNKNEKTGEYESRWRWTDIVYGRFTHKKNENRWRWTDIAPDIVIVDPGGNEFVSKKMEYG